MARVCAICASTKRASIDQFLRRGLTYSKFRSKFPGFTRSQWGRHRSHLAQQAEAVIEADGRVTGKETLEEKDLRAVNKKLRVLAARANRAGKVVHAIAAYTAISRNLEIMQRVTAKSAEAAQPPPALTVVFRAVEEVELARLQARQAIAQLDPGSAVLRDAAPQPQPQPKPRETNKDEVLCDWAELGKGERPN